MLKTNSYYAIKIKPSLSIFITFFMSFCLFTTLGSISFQSFKTLFREIAKSHALMESLSLNEVSMFQMEFIVNLQFGLKLYYFFAIDLWADAQSQDQSEHLLLQVISRYSGAFQQKSQSFRLFSFQLNFFPMIF
jgi:hypothetical protein